MLLWLPVCDRTCRCKQNCDYDSVGCALIFPCPKIWSFSYSMYLGLLVACPSHNHTLDPDLGLGCRRLSTVSTMFLLLIDRVEVQGLV